MPKIIRFFGSQYDLFYPVTPVLMNGREAWEDWTRVSIRKIGGETVVKYVAGKQRPQHQLDLAKEIRP